MKKAAASNTVKTIVDAIKEASENGTFGNFTIDPSRVKVSYVKLAMICLVCLP